MKTYCEVLYPGSFFPEEQVIEVKLRRPAAIAKKYPGAFSFQFFDQVSKEVEVDGAKRTVSGDRRNLSPKYFPGAEVFDIEGLEKLKGGDYGILISNMKCNNWPKVVRTRRGNFQPFDKDCEVIP